MEVKASLRHLHMAPRKVRLVVDLVRGLPVSAAEQRLKFNGKDAARPVLKLLNSAVANAEHNFKLDKADLFIKAVSVDGGPVMKRMRPRAMGRGVTIRKRLSHINIVLSDGKAVVPKAEKVEKKVEKADKPVKTVKSEKTEKTETKAKRTTVRKPKAAAKSPAAKNA